jgi:hypothetical protein
MAVVSYDNLNYIEGSSGGVETNNILFARNCSDLGMKVL